MFYLLAVTYVIRIVKFSWSSGRVKKRNICLFDIYLTLLNRNFEDKNMNYHKESQNWTRAWFLQQNRYYNIQGLLKYYWILSKPTLIHSFIHYKHLYSASYLYSASSSGATQRRFQPQHDQIEPP